MRRGVWGFLFVALTLQLSLAACAIPERLLAVPKALTTQAKVTQVHVSPATNKRDGIDYNLAYLGTDFDAPDKEDFDTAYMQQLFDYGYKLAQEGYPWQKHPPGFALATNGVAP